jgi:hypothetical protein
MRDDKRKLQVHGGTGNGSGDAYQCNYRSPADTCTSHHCEELIKQKQLEDELTLRFRLL